MKKKTLKTVALVGAAYLAYKALSGGKGLLAGLAGLADDSFNTYEDVNPPVIQYPPNYFGGGAYGGYPGYGYPSYGYGQYNYGQQYSPFNYYGQPYIYPGSPGFQFNPYGGQDYYGTYIPKVVTPSGGIQGFSY